MSEPTMSPLPDARIARAYLLGAATDPEVEALEAGLFADEAALDAVAEAEDELIDDFLAGRLSGDEQSRFERHYLASAIHRRRVDVTRELRRRASARPTLLLRRRATRFVLALAAAIVGMVTWFALRPDGGRVASLLVPPPAVRGQGDLPSIELDAKTRQLELRLERGETALRPPLRATIATVDGVERWRGPALAPAGGEAATLAAIVPVPASVLPSGDYVVALFDASATDAAPAERYAFRVVRR